MCSMIQGIGDCKVNLIQNFHKKFKNSRDRFFMCGSFELDSL
jgi:hypothetical protein